MSAKPKMFKVTLTDGGVFIGAIADNHGWYVDTLEDAKRRAIDYKWISIYPFATLTAKGQGWRIPKSLIVSVEDE